jgi:hypothetical protein
VWTTARKWELVERETRALFEYARPVDFADAVARHVAVSALASSLREDPASAMTPEPARAPSMPVIGSALARVDRDHPAPLRASMRWTSAPHARAVARLWPVALWASPLTPLLDPTLAPPHWAPSTGAAFLRHRGLARAIVFGWARQRDWLAVGSVVAGAALQEMGLFSQRLAAGTAGPGSSPERRAGLRTLSRDGGDVGDVGEGEASPTGTSTAPALRLAASRTEVSALLHVFAALVHLHVVKLLEFDARIEPARDLPTQAFLAMPLLLRTLAPRLGDPFTGVEDVALMRRWSDHLEHLAAIVPGELVLSLVAAIAAPATPTSPTPRPSLESM